MTGPLAPADWRTVRTHIDARLTDLQGQLESPRHDAEATAVLRGRIAELRALIEWGEPAHVDVSALSETVGY